MSDIISNKDRIILRDLAKKQLEYAKSDENADTIQNWYRHNACEGERPMVHLELWTFQDEVIPKRLRCESERAREIESALYRNFLNHELFHDDFPVPNYFPLQKDIHLIPFSMKVKKTQAQGSVGHKFIHYIHDLEDDFEKLGESKIVNNKAKTDEDKQFLENIFGDIIPVREVINCLYSVPTQDIVHIMSMETMYIAMLDCPELFHEMMKKYTADTLQYFRYLESEKLLEATTFSEDLGQGSWCFTDELPKKNATELKTTDLWGYMDSQETVAISPAMFEEFIFPYYKEISDNFGLLSYGCCEHVHAIWESCISKMNNLRKVSISPWCDIDYMAEQLRGRKIIFHRKPSPNYLGVDKVLDEDAFREHMKQTIKAAKGCTLEITQRDVYTINNDEHKAKRYVEIIREEIENGW
ncbi:MAG: hypothetical protein FWD05_07080 [Oscillospiraceae bacterium]|nr:hypothetical protein [Oscillospiraceae bacterium]